MRRTLNSPKTGHASQSADRIGPYGHSIPERTSARLKLRGIL